MGRYLLQRVVQGGVVAFGVTVLVFVIARLAPGDPARLLLPETAPEEAVQAMRKELGLSRPIPVQFARFLSRAARGDMGESLYFTGQKVVRVVQDSLPATVELAAVASALTVAVAIPLGILAAVRRGSLWEQLSLLVAILGQSLPVFYLGLLLILLFAVKLHLLPTSGAGSWRHLVLPAVTLAAYSMALITRLTRSAMLDELGQNYVQTARAKGLREHVVVYRHALRNALLPVVTVVGLQIGGMLGGVVVTEAVFNYPGVGTLVYNAISTRDYPLLQALVLMLAMLFIAINLVTDLAYATIDPRIQYR